jgi:hypothetical protein
MADGEERLSDFSARMKAEFDPSKIGEYFQTMIGELEKYGTAVNKTFGQSKERIVEIKTAIADTLPEFTRLGGSVAEVEQTISTIAESTRRNVIATTEQSEKLFATMKVTGVQVKTLVDGFTDVGVGLGQMGKQIEGSVNYIRSIGGNTQQIFKTVTDNIEQLNRFQFEGGVQGLTKMAAQASMLRFDMGETFRLADKVLDPEGAVNMAAAFQRLGVSVGNLADPFQLMNQSINDPSGLQDSLAKVSKQFTYFDESTKTFKINPQGVLTLREIETQAGLTRGSLSKMGLAAAELDARLSDVGKAGIKFANEEDKQYLANIAKMGDGGEYEVKINDTETVKLSQLTQEEFNKLIKEQKEGPKTIEDIGKSQLTLTESMSNNIKSIKDAIVGGASTSRTLQQGLAGFDRIAKTVTDEVAKSFKPSDSRKVSETLIQDFEGLLKDAKSGKPANIVAADFLDKIGSQQSKLGLDIKDKLGGALERISSKLGDKTYGESLIKNLSGQLSGKISGKELPSTTKTANVESKSPIYSQLSGNNKFNSEILSKNVTNPTQTKSTVDVGGKIVVEFNTPNGSELSKKVLDDWANSPQTKQYFMSLTKTDNPTKAPSKTTYGN